MRVAVKNHALPVFDKNRIALLLCIFETIIQKDSITSVHDQFYRVKSGKFGRSAKSGQPRNLYYSSIIEIKNKLTKQTVKILMRRLIRSRLIWIYTVCKCVSEFTWCPNLPDFTLF